MRRAGSIPRAGWGKWSGWSPCASACLLDEGGAPAAAGVSTAGRRCGKPRHENGKSYCHGHDKKYQSCQAPQCQNVPGMTIREFADQICLRARDVDPDLIGTGLQRMDADDASSKCAVWCDTRGGGYKSRGWSFPDGTACSLHSPKFCINGVCRKFSCTENTDEEFALSPGECEWEALQIKTASSHINPVKAGSRRRAVTTSWRALSGCHYRCMTRGVGLRLVQADRRSVQLCRPDEGACRQIVSPYQYATMVCSKYKERVRRLSGLGMQISPALEDPDRPCRVACQDERAAHRFYLVNGHEGWFPLGTACSRDNSSYCVSGKCLQFGPDNTPLTEMVFTLPLLPRNTSDISRRSSRHKRSLYSERITVKSTLDRTHLEDIIARLNLTDKKITYIQTIPDNIELDFTNPIHISPEETFIRKIPRPTWD